MCMYHKQENQLTSFRISILLSCSKEKTSNASCICPASWQAMMITRYVFRLGVRPALIMSLSRDTTSPNLRGEGRGFRIISVLVAGMSKTQWGRALCHSLLLFSGQTNIHSTPFSQHHMLTITLI